MHYARLFILTAILSQPVIAEEMSAEERCSKLGDIAKQASQMRLDGKDMNEALDTMQKADNAGLPDDMVNGAVRVSYMAKMNPNSMRNYYISQCEKDILR
jgi:hypothetical protein